MTTPLVLLHSSGANATLWDRVREHLTSVPVLVPDLPGRRGVPWPAEESDRDVAAYARFVLAFLDREGVGPATIAGASLGGAIAMQIALEQPRRAVSLGLIGTGARLRVLPAVLEGLADGVRDTIDVMVNAHAAASTTDKDRVALHRMFDSTGLEQTLTDLRACDSFDVMDRIGSIRVPARIIAGNADVLTPLKYAQYMERVMPGARITVVEGVGHALPLERAQRVAAELAVLWATTS